MQQGNRVWIVAQRTVFLGTLARSGFAQDGYFSQ
jgi:hypothetical protein